MIAVIQRVKRASVTADGLPSGSCGVGFLILLGVLKEDDREDARLLAEKISQLRIFEDAAGKMNLALADVSGGVLVVSNFTLGANYAHGNRPDFFGSASPNVAEPLYEAFKTMIAEKGIPCESGVFGADMQIDMVADGPVTIVMDSLVLRKGKKG